MSTEAPVDRLKPCMACVVRDNPAGKATTEFAYLVGLHDESRLPGVVRQHLCADHKRELENIVGMYALAATIREGSS